MGKEYIRPSETCEWSTPQDLFDRLDQEFHFETDVCASDENHKCDHYYTLADDGLKQEWTGVCWCNPPYGRQIKDWIKKACESNALTVFLVPSRTGRNWFHDYIYGKHEIRFLRGRLKFGGVDGVAPFDSMLIIVNNLSH